jgi:hypothetical protein
MSGKVHVLPDENLGGVLREFVEVDRKAEVGDYVANEGLIGKYRFEEQIFTYVYFDGAYDGKDVWYTHKCKTLEPTDIVRLREENGTERRYRLVDRKAKVGEKVVVTNALKGERDNCAFDNGHVATVISVGEKYITVNPCAHLYHFEYSVLEPVEPTQTAETEPVEVDTRHASPQVVDMLANLAQRITEIERKLDDSRIDFIENELDTLHANQRKLAEETTNRLDRHSERIRELAEMIGEQKVFKTFKFSDLNGKTLRIYSAQDVTDKSTTTVTVGIDIHDGNMYVLDSTAEVTRK